MPSEPLKADFPDPPGPITLSFKTQEGMAIDPPFSEDVIPAIY